MIKVCVITSVHSPFDVRIFEKECRSLSSHGFDVVLVAPHDRDEIRGGVRIVATARFERRLARLAFSWLGAMRVAWREAADIYHIHDPELLVAAVVLRLFGKRVIYDVHEDLPAAILSKHYLPPWTRRMLSIIIGHLEVNASRQCAAFVFATPAISERFETLGKPSAVVQNFPIPDELASPRGIPWKQRQMAVAYVGSITAIRGIVEIVRALELLPRSLCVSLELAGEFSPSGLRARLETLSGWKRVRYHGVLSRTDLARVLSQVRAGLVLFLPEPNHMSAYPTKLFEYMSAGLPVIASDFPMWRRIVLDANCGVLADPTDVHAIARAMEYLLRDQGSAATMGEAGRDAVATKYRWAAEEQKLIALYRDITDSMCE